MSKGAGIFIATHFKINSQERPIHERARDKNPRIVVELEKQNDKIDGITKILFQNGEKQQELQPDILIISAGYDANYSDPLGNMCLFPPDYGKFTQYIQQVTSKILFGLEGGYELNALADSVVATIEACLTVLD